ncbi:TPA: M28 family peptidase [Stenotrophomonas maltophilia]
MSSKRESRPKQQRASRIVAFLLSLATTTSAAGAATPGTLPDHKGMPSSAEIFSYVEDITDFGPRRTGSQANMLTADYIAGKFRDAGLKDVQIETGDTSQWTATRWGLAVAGTSIPAFYMRHSFHPGHTGSFQTPAGGLQAPIVYVGNRKDLSNIDVRGKIVVADVELGEINLTQMMGAAKFVHDPARTLTQKSKTDPFTPNNFPFNFASAMKGGAVGFIGILSNYIDSNRFYNEDLAYFVDDDLHLSLPGLWVSRKDGERLKTLAAQPGGAKANLVLEGKVEPVKYRTVVGYLPGRSAETLMVQSHHDSGFAGAVEDASGTAEVLALAKYYGQQAAGTRSRSMMFVAMDSHFTGYEAHVDFAKKHILSSAVDVVANVTIEHVAREMIIENGKAVMTGLVEPRVLLTSASLQDLATKAVKQRDYRRSMVVGTSLFQHEEGLPTDVGPIQKLTGIPVISFISAPVYLYDIGDTLDKVAVEELQPTALVAADLLDSLDAMPRKKIGRDE